MKKKKRKSNLLLNIILVIAILCFLGSGGYLLKYYMDGWQKEKSMDSLRYMKQAMRLPARRLSNSPYTVAALTHKIYSHYYYLYNKNNSYILLLNTMYKACLSK